MVGCVPGLWHGRGQFSGDESLGHGPHQQEGEPQERVEGTPCAHNVLNTEGTTTTVISNKGKE